MKKIAGLVLGVVCLMAILGFGASAVHSYIKGFSHCDAVMGFDVGGLIDCAGNDIFNW